MFKSILKLMFFGGLLGLVLAAWLAWLLLSPVTMRSERIEFHIAPGSGLRAVAGEIVNAGVNFEPRLFILLGKAMRVEAAIKAGLNVDDFAGRLSFFWNAHNNVLEEVAKFRASRRVWAKVMKERFHAQKPKSMMLRVHTQTAGSMLTA